MISGHQTRSALQVHFGTESSVSGAAVRWQLEKILASVAFTRAGQMSRFLEFIVEETLCGKGSELKEYRIGVEVFDRKDSYDPRIDPVVRCGARRLRAKLLEYYEEEGCTDSIRIHLKKGSYAAVFEPHGARAPDVEEVPIAAKSTPPGSQSIAVLPFLNLSPDPENEYFSDGLTEELIQALGKLSDLKVVARTSVFQFRGKAYDVREIGEQLHVRMVLEGSVRKFGEQLRIATQLINATDGYHIWSDSYDRSALDPLTTQRELSLAIVNTLKEYWLGPAEPHSAARVSSTRSAA